MLLVANSTDHFLSFPTVSSFRSQKTDKTNPKWFMVDLKFESRTKNFVSLALLRRIASISVPPAPSKPGSDPQSCLPDDVGYIGTEGVEAIKCKHLAWGDS